MRRPFRAPDSRCSPARFAAAAAICVALGTALACTTPTVDGVAPDYDPTALTAGLLYHWPVGREISIHVPSGDADTGLESTVRTAASRWQPALAYRELRFRIVDRIDQADIIIHDRATPSPVDAGDCGGVHQTESPGSTTFCRLGPVAPILPLRDGPPGRAKVLITLDVAAMPDPSQLLAVTVHELGHAIGIGGHSPNASDVMFAAPTVARASGADARTLRYVLHRPPNLTL